MSGKSFEPSDKVVSIAEFLQQRDYATAAFVSATPLKPLSGIQQGFTDYNFPEEKLRDGDETTNRALKWLDERGETPFFLWVHLFDPHKPYRDSPAIEVFPDEPTFEAHLKARQMKPTENPKRKERAVSRKNINAYDGEIKYADQQLGRLLDALREQDLSESTAIVVMGDHGEGLGQHGQAHHGYVWDEHLHVPLLFHVPGVPSRRISQLISIVDVFPTLLGMIDVPDEALFLSNVSGIDALNAPEGPRAILSQSSLRRTRLGIPLTFSLTNENWKYVSASDGDQRLYDLRVDPFELNDISEEWPQKLKHFEASLRKQVAQQRERNFQLGGTHEVDLNESMLKELEALGYVVEDDEEE
jgi:choline-sulfatase